MLQTHPTLYASLPTLDPTDNFSQLPSRSEEPSALGATIVPHQGTEAENPCTWASCPCPALTCIPGPASWLPPQLPPASRVQDTLKRLKLVTIHCQRLILGVRGERGRQPQSPSKDLSVSFNQRVLWKAGSTSFIWEPEAQMAREQSCSAPGDICKP